MSEDLSIFILSLTRWLAAQGSLDGESSTQRQIWAQVADEARAADPFSVVTCYGGPALQWDPTPIALVQVKTIGRTGWRAAMSRSSALFALLCDAEGKPRRELTIPRVGSDGQEDGEIRVISFDPVQRPGLISMEGQRSEVVFNVEIAFHAVS